MATTALYRQRSKEVVKISLKGQPFSDRNQTYWGVLTDPTLPDGTAVRPSIDGVLGPLRVLGYAKIVDANGTTIRNATQAEIDTFSAAEAADAAAQDVDRGAALFETHPQWRRVFKAILRRVLQVTNAQADQYNALRAQVLAATSLANLQTRVGANTQNVNTYTVAQALTALKNDLSVDD